MRHEVWSAGCAAHRAEARSSGDLHIVIGVPTFRRSDRLGALLHRLVEEGAAVGSFVRVVVADNDPAGSARSTVCEWSECGVEYHCEPRPGVAAARNRILDACGDADVLVFIDDDQVPSPGWLRHLVGSWSEWQCAAVAGSLEWAGAQNSDEWVQASGRFERRRFPSGAARAGAGTGNLLVDLDFVRRHRLRFDDRFGLSGGEDTLFTRTLVARGGTIRWCDEAEVVEHVPAERLTRAWVLRRDTRAAGVWVRVHLELEPKLLGKVRTWIRLLLLAAARFARGAARVVLGRSRREIATGVAGERDFASGIGLLQGLFGTVVQEYRRA